jgi:hypothetical protein
MKPALVKLTVDLLAPGAIITPTLAQYYTTWRTFHSRRIMYPVMDKKVWEVIDMQEDGGKVLVDFSHIRVTSIMDGWNGVTDGELDRLLTMKRLDEVFDLRFIADAALMKAPPYHLNKTGTSLVCLYEVEGEVAKFVRLLSVTEIHKLAQAVAQSAEQMIDTCGGCGSPLSTHYQGQRCPSE